jgi:hypothetical protein
MKPSFKHVDENRGDTDDDDEGDEGDKATTSE